MTTTITQFTSGEETGPFQASGTLEVRAAQGILYRECRAEFSRRGREGC